MVPANYWILSLLMLLALNEVHVIATTKSEKSRKLTERNFQINYLNELRHAAEGMAREQLNQFLGMLKPISKNPLYASALEKAKLDDDVVAKVVFIKQFLDVENLVEDPSAEHKATALRNINFLIKLDKELRQLQDKSLKELREFRMYELCRQFRDKNYDGIQTTTYEPPYAIHRTKLEPIHHDSLGIAVEKSNATIQGIKIDLNSFGRSLYVKVNNAGGEIIDDYLISLRKLLEEVIVEKYTHEQDSSQLTKVLDEIDVILDTTDFYEKRQKLYGYLEQNLAADYEQFKASEQAQADLSDILTRLRERGMDLFVTFLFSNFEFLEHLHKELAQLLPQVSEAAVYDENARLLYEVCTSYIDFKRDSENNDKYDAYLVVVRELDKRTLNLANDSHIFELLHNASLNVGIVTLNMIRAKCDEM